MPKIIFDGVDTGIEVNVAKDGLRKSSDFIEKIIATETNYDVIEIKASSVPDNDFTPAEEFNFQVDGYITPDTDPNDFPPALLPYITFAGGEVKLAPGVDPSTIPPHLLPYVTTIQKRQDHLGKLQGHAIDLQRDNVILRRGHRALMTGGFNMQVKRL
ncbi:MAG: hypothetical protein V7776_03310 [Halopseudomonas aestusnigri]